MRGLYLMYFDKPLLDKLSRLKHIPTLPHILLQLIKTCNSDKGSLKEISAIVEKDPALTTRILTLVNSAYYSKSSKVTNVDGAVIFLGMNAIKNVAVCSSVHEVFQNVESRKGFNLKYFWWHSLRCAILAKLIAKKQKYCDPEDVFLFGMLHDIGKIILLVNFPEQYSELLEKRKDRPDLILAGETQIGANHAEIGAWLLDQWNFPHQIADAVLCHHHSAFDMLSAPPLAQFIYVANLLSSDSEPKIKEGLAAAEKIFGFTQAMAQELLSRTDEELAATAESLNISIEPFKSNNFEYSADDRQQQIHLTQEVQDRSLLLSTVQNMLEATDEAAVWKEIAQGLHILFELSSIFFFVYEPETSDLRGVVLPDAVKSTTIKDMMVPLKTEKSLLIECLQSRKVTDSFNRSAEAVPSMPDKQIITLLNKDGIACIPMVAYGEKVGVIVLGLNPTEFSNIKSQIKLLQMMADQAAVAVRVHHLGRSKLLQTQPEKLQTALSSTQNNSQKASKPTSILKKYLKRVQSNLVA